MHINHEDLYTTKFNKKFEILNLNLYLYHISLNLKTNFFMKGFFDIKDQNTFLGGQNVHNLLILGALAYIIFKK